MSEIGVNTSQNVLINFKIASIGERMLAFGIDMVIKIAYILFFWFIFYKIINGIFDNPHYNTILVIILMLPIIFYTFIFEILMEGQTLGKKLMNIKVIKIDGYQASFGDYLMRWIFRLVDIFTNGGVIGLIAMISSKHNQRLGDLATGTAVISLKNDVNISHTILENIVKDYEPLFPQVIILSDHDMQIIKDSFQKALRTNDAIIINQLVTKLKEILKIEQQQIKEFTSNQFITTIIQDYNFFTGKSD